MAHSRLFILLEGDDDERFFNRLMKPQLLQRYDSVEVWKYAQETKKKVNSFLQSIKAMQAEYIYLTDVNGVPCATARKQKTQSKYPNLDEHGIMVAIKEIESWYLAGMDVGSSKQLGIPHFRDTDNLTKENFNAIIPKKFTSRVDFMQELLKYFKFEIAKRKNKSLAYFLQKKS